MVVEDRNQDTIDAYESTASIMAANLLLFKTVIAGDSWGTIAVPIIRRQPFTALIFCGSLMTLVFGVLNLIVAVIVDTFAEARERDIMNLAEELELSHEDDKKFLRKMFDRLDVEGNGEVTLDDLVNGARQDPEFQSRLRVMDIDEVDLEQLFHMIDADSSGTVEADEFIAPLSRWVHESKTATRFIKYNLMRAMHQQEDFFNDCQREIEDLSCRIRDLTNFMEGMSSQSAVTNQASHASLREDRTPVTQLPTESMDSIDFVAAPDVEIEQPKDSKKEMTTDLLRSALETAERRLAAGTEEALKRSLHVLEGVLQDVFRDLSLEYLDGERTALLYPSR
ncbi:FP1, partial [Symbiodinium sp. KB8]